MITEFLLQSLSHVEPVPVWLPEQGSVAGALDAAVEAAAAEGHPVKALLLTNPMNPQVKLVSHFSHSTCASMLASIIH